MLLEPLRIRRQQADGTVISRHVPGIAALAMLQNRDMRDRAQSRELAEFGRHVSNEQRRPSFREPLRDCGEGLRYRWPAERRAVDGIGGRQCGHGRCLLPGGFEQRWNGLHHYTLVERGEDVVPGAEQSHAARFDQRVGNRGRAFGVAPPLMVNEISDRAVLAHAGTLPAWRPRTRCAR